MKSQTPIRRAIARIDADVRALEGGGMRLLYQPMVMTPERQKAWNAEHAVELRRCRELDIQVIVIRRAEPDQGSVAA